MVYGNVINSAWRPIDRFEGGMHAPQPVSIELHTSGLLAAETYIVRREYIHRMDDSDLDFAEFLRNGKTLFLSGYGGFSTLE